ncbi:MAG: phosphopantetheine-binding protein [Pirellulaceae bacterium]|nr:acyl carrier protein [Planctomycetales bacterium]
MPRDVDAILVELADLLSNFQGREYSDPITAETTFFGELGFASIDAVVLGETLEATYGQTLPFGAFLSELRDRQVEDLTVGELAEFLSRSLS